MDYREEPEQSQNINEPTPAYNANANVRMRFFSSFQEQEDEMATYWASITPVQRLKHLHEMIIHSFGLTDEQLKNPKLSRSLRVISYMP